MNNSRIEGFMWGVWAGILLAYIVRTPDDADAGSRKDLKDGDGLEKGSSHANGPQPLRAKSREAHDYPAQQVQLFRQRPTPLGACS